MPTTLQLLKASGSLTQIPLDDLAGAEAMAAVADLDFVTGNNLCGHPHNVDDEIIASDPDTLSVALDMPRDYCEQLIEGMTKMKQAATGRGAYPPGCNPAYPGLHAVAYFDDKESRPAHLRRRMTDAEFQSIIDAKVWGPSGNHNGIPFNMAQLKATWGESEMGDVVNEFAEETYRRFGVILYQVFTGENGFHNIHVSYPFIPGSTIGVGWFPGSNPCPGDHVNLHIDKGYTSGFQGQFGLKIHELGHTVQLYHQFSNQGSHQEPMSYSYSNHLVVGYSTGEPVFKLPKSPSVARLVELYGGEPVGKPWKGKFDSTPVPPVTPPVELKPFNIEIHPAKDPSGRIYFTDQFVYGGESFIVQRLNQVN